MDQRDVINELRRAAEAGVTERETKIFLRWQRLHPGRAIPKVLARAVEALVAAFAADKGWYSAVYIEADGVTKVRVVKEVGELRHMATAELHLLADIDLKAAVAALKAELAKERASHGT